MENCSETNWIWHNECQEEVKSWTQTSLIGLRFGVGVEDHQKDGAQLGIEAVNRKEQMVYATGQTPKLDNTRAGSVCVNNCVVGLNV